MIDTDRLLSNIDLRAVVSAELGGPDRSGNWNCPFHSDRTPSFGVVKQNDQLAHCFSCSWTGDAIRFIMDLHKIDFKTACERLSGGTMPTTGQVKKHAPRPATRQSETPCGKWSNRAGEIADRAFKTLWSDAGAEGLNYLLDRGFTETTLQAFRVGYIGDDLREPGESWGLDGGDVWTPKGIAIPWRIDRQTWRLNIRRLEGDPKYIGPRGFKNGLFNVDRVRHDRPVVLVEGEFDAMAIWQVASDVVVPVATGSTGGARVSRWLYKLAAVPRVFVAFDADKAGDDASAWWLDQLPNGERLRPEGGKDAGDMLKAGTLRKWITKAVERLLEDDEWGKWSDREIARRCRVDNSFVSKMRKSLAIIHSDRTYTDRHGNTSTMDTANIGKQAERRRIQDEANADHGLRRTNADKRKAVLTLLNDPEWVQWPQRKIAEVCRVSPEYVSRLKKREGASIDRSIDGTRTVERNGTTYEQDTANTGGAPAFPSEWLKRFTCKQLERLAIRTIDGEMTDDEALAAEGVA